MRAPLNYSSPNTWQNHKDSSNRQFPFNIKQRDSNKVPQQFYNAKQQMLGLDKSTFVFLEIQQRLKYFEYIFFELSQGIQQLKVELRKKEMDKMEYKLTTQRSEQTIFELYQQLWTLVHEDSQNTKQSQPHPPPNFTQYPQYPQPTSHYQSIQSVLRQLLIQRTNSKQTIKKIQDDKDHIEWELFVLRNRYNEKIKESQQAKANCKCKQITKNSQDYILQTDEQQIDKDKSNKYIDVASLTTIVDMITTSVQTDRQQTVIHNLLRKHSSLISKQTGNSTYSEKLSLSSQSLLISTQCDHSKAYQRILTDQKLNRPQDYNHEPPQQTINKLLLQNLKLKALVEQSQQNYRTLRESHEQNFQIFNQDLQKLRQQNLKFFGQHESRYSLVKQKINELLRQQIQMCILQAKMPGTIIIPPESELTPPTSLPYTNAAKS